ncbi:MAG: hypothetical protein ACRC1K_08810 [Planctomycetia bacterium]
MPRHVRNFRFQKCTDVAKELPIFEVLTEDGDTIMDISMNDDNGSIEVFFHDGIANAGMDCDLLGRIVDEGKRLLDEAK